MNTSRIAVGGILLFASLATLLHDAGLAGNDQRKSLVLKDRVPERNLFHFDPDNTRREMWNEFMLVKDANSGDPVAQHELGLRYLMGKGFVADTQKAAYWIVKAAEQNLLPARYNLGILLNNGLSVPWNPFEAYKHFKYCAEHGMVESQYVFGLLLTDNLTVPKDYAEAYRWMKLASDSGYTPAQEVLAEFRKRGFDRLHDSDSAGKKQTASNHAAQTPSGAVVPAPAVRPVILDFMSDATSDSVTAPDHKELLQEALANANEKLKEELINVSLDSIGVRGDSTAWKEIVRSAEAGNPEAMTLVGYRYETGDGVRRDRITASAYYVRAMRYESSSASIRLWKLTQQEQYFSELKKAVDAGNPRAQFVWAGLTLFGLDRQLTEDQAIGLLEKSARQKYTPAIVELGIRAYTGAGMKQDKALALELFDRGAKLGSTEARLRGEMVRFYSSKGGKTDPAVIASLTKAADQGSVLAEEILGYVYASGVGVDRNIPESVKYYRKAAQRGSTIAYGALRNLYDEHRPPASEFHMKD